MNMNNNTFEELNAKYSESTSDSVMAISSIWANESFKLAEGDLIFSYKNTKFCDCENNFFGIIIFRNTEKNGPIENIGNFSVIIVTKDYSVTYPNVPLTYLQTELVDTLKDFCIEEEILTTYKQIIDNDDLKRWDYYR